MYVTTFCTDLRALPNLIHTAYERSPREGVHDEGGRLAHGHPTDVGFVHVRLDLHLGQVTSDREQGGPLKGRGDRLPEIDITRHDDTIHRGIDIRAFEIDLRLLEGRLSLSNLGKCAVDLGLGDF